MKQEDVGRTSNVTPDEWRAMLERSANLQRRALYDAAAKIELSAINGKIRRLGSLPADGS